MKGRQWRFVALLAAAFAVADPAVTGEPDDALELALLFPPVKPSDYAAAASAEPPYSERHPFPEEGGAGIFRNVCLRPHGDRLAFAAPPKGAVFAPGYTFLAADLCAMGHTTKDAALALSLALDLEDVNAAAEEVEAKTRAEEPAPEEAEDKAKEEDRAGGARGLQGSKAPKAKRKMARAGERHVRRIVYGNRCMTRDRPGHHGLGRKAPVFHNVLLHWLQAASRPAPSAAVDYEGSSGRVEPGHEAHGRRSWDEFFYEDFLNPRAGGVKGGAKGAKDEDEEKRGDDGEGERPQPPQCYAHVATRKAEQYRWFRRPRHAFAFRRRLLRHYGIVGGNATGPQEGLCRGVAGNRNMTAHAVRARPPYRVTVLVRDEDRHFNEAHATDVLQRGLPAGLVSEVISLKFDRSKGTSAKPPPHREQLCALLRTDVLVAAHGAGLAGMAGMARGSHVVELFPNNFRYYMYEELADVLGVGYTAFESPHVHPPRCCVGRGGDDMPAYAAPQDGNGVKARACKGCDILISDTELLDTVRHALADVEAARSAAPGPLL